MLIRNEKAEDYRAVEELTKKAFWNVYDLGCDEHFLVNQMRKHEDFIAQLDFVLEIDNCIAANIMFVKSKLIDENGNIKHILTFGPLSVLPKYQRKGYGKKLIEYSCQKAIELNYDCIIIFGNPENYIGSGFKSCKRYNVHMEDGTFPTALLVKELKENTLANESWTFYESSVYDLDMTNFDEFDQSFEQYEKAYQPIQELFYIYSRSSITK